MANYVQLVAGVRPDALNTPLLRASLESVLTVPSQANTDFIVPVPKGARNVNFRVITDTAFGAATDCQISIGKTVGGAEYVAATTVKAVGVYALTNVNAQAADYESLPQDGINVRLVQSGAASATGQAKLYVDYSMPG